jgi:predicted ATP-grasp superfamily ATP-dependent carboligase
MTTDNASDFPALVVGFSIHGLAVARALAKAGVEVHCVAEAESPKPPTVYTRYARVYEYQGLNTEALPAILMDVAAKISCGRKIALFPTNDRIVRSIIDSLTSLSEHYVVSWAHCRDLVLRLQRKDSLAEYCEASGIKYPRTRIISGSPDCATVASDLRFPIVVKPARPLSAFKAIKLHNNHQLKEAVQRYSQDLPFVAQEWVEGPEPSLYACTSFLDRGRTLFSFTSRKLAAHPPGLGQGTVFETTDDESIKTLTESFLAQLDLSGPVAVEFKKDAAGQFWFIEPNVGRTEHCVDLAIQAGYNLPYIEYLYIVGRADEICAPAKPHHCVWFDTDKDPWCAIRNRHALAGGTQVRRRAVFPFIGHNDLRPLTVSLLQQARGLFLSFVHRMSKQARRPPLSRPL